MQNAGQQYGQGGASFHQTAPFSGHSETTTSSGSITSSLRQFRRKNEDKHNHTDNNTASVTNESHVARVAPHSHYPPRSSVECYRYPTQYPDYGLQQPVKYSEISEPHPQLPEQTSPSVIQKAKGKEYMEMCNMQQHRKPSYDHMNGQQNYSESFNQHDQYESINVHPSYRRDPQFMPKDPEFCKQSIYLASTRKNDYLSRLQRIHPNMARSIMSDHHLQETQNLQNLYQDLQKSVTIRKPQHQIFANYPNSIQNNTYPHGYVPYTNYNCNYNRPPQMTPRFPPVNPHERSMSPRRSYSGQMSFPTNYDTIAAQKLPPAYPQYNAPEYAQHYQHRGASMGQDYYQRHCSPTQYLAPHQIPPPDITEGRVTVSDNIKHYIENWADEETATEMNQIENPRMCKESIRGRDDQSTETVYMINASELQYLENGLLTSENGMTVPVMASESGQYVIKSEVSLEGASEMVRIVEKSSQLEVDPATGERVVNLHIMDTVKPDCMLNSKLNESHQRSLENPYTESEKPRVLVHQNTVITSGNQITNETNERRDTTRPIDETLKLGNSLPLISDTLEELNKTIMNECRKETVDKNCSPINLEEIEKYREQETTEKIKSSADCLVEEIASIQEMSNSPKNNSFEDAHINMIKTDIITHRDDQNSLLKDSHKDIEALFDSSVKNTQSTQPEMKNNSFNEIDEEDKSTTENKNNNISKEEKLITEKTINETEQQSTSSDNFTEEIIQIPEKKDHKEEESKINSDNTTHNDLSLAIDTDKIDKRENEDAAITSLEVKKTEKTVTKRSRRIFSVDDIINNIGKKLRSTESNSTSRRYSLKTTKEFLEMEITNTFKSIKLPTIETRRDEKIQTFSTKNNDNNVLGVEEKQVNSNGNVEKLINSINTSVDNYVMEVMNEESTIISKSEKESEFSEPYEISKENELEKQECTNFLYLPENEFENQQSTNLNLQSSNDSVFPEPLAVTEEIVLNVKDIDSQETITKDEISSDPSNVKSLNLSEKPCEVTEESSLQCKPVSTVASPVKDTINTTEDSSLEPKVPDQQEVQYRNVIRVEESTVLLEIAGELVEINVNIVNGKNIITVVPLSDTAVVDFNDNYETSENPEATDPLKLDDVPPQQETLAGIAQVNIEAPESDIVETTSEIIIGMDLSLEEEIKLDVDQPPIIFTKAAKKAYDCDLQIPSITTSGDILDSTRVKTYNLNDKVSSTKAKTKKIKNVESDSLKSLKRLSVKSDKKSLFRDLIAARNRKKIKLEMNDNEDDEFVPFKDLIRARKLRKIKLKEMKNSEEAKVDSTIKIDENNKEAEIVEEVTDVHELIDSKIEKFPEESNEFRSEAFSEVSANTSDKKQKSVYIERKCEYTPEVIPTNVKQLDDPKLPKPNENLPKSQIKKKLSLEEYNKRKRKLLNPEKSESTHEKKSKIERKQSEVETSKTNPKKNKPQRTKSLDDLNLLKSKETQSKRKLSLEYSPVKQNYFDWEETQSPKVNISQKDQDSKICEFKGLINNNNKNKPKVLIDINDFNSKPNNESSEDEILQNYKEQVESKLNTLNFQIPKPAKSLERQIVNPFSKPETNSLIERFLKNEKLNGEEMEKIRKIISYKRLMQQLKKIKNHDLSRTTSLNPAYEVRKELSEKQTKLLLKKVSEKKKSRFRNLHSTSDSETEHECREKTRCSGDYSVVQSVCLAGVVPKLIIKRKTEMPLPFVRLERLDLGLLEEKNGRYVG
ncbi:uncharacterized protein PF3D7_1120600-like [Diorhabda carinulata]|uniref:uncharacterized protein PF3D7_1120600-like n=1 Tax=Diorhabda carinulata TaxID=1163345 RepID=UPI0025A26C5E|nr:uncharacterized protein PF3D7_1120600-like [Diorhabda carinulata]